MCRFLAYVGPPLPLSSLLVDPSHSLVEQAYQPRCQANGNVNVDGFGVGWYDLAVRPEPALHRTRLPIWADPSFASFGPLVSSGCFIATVRGATYPSPTEESNTHPFAVERWLFTHNGVIDGFREGVAVQLRRHTSDRRQAGIFGSTESEVLFAMALTLIDDGASIEDALGQTVRTAASISGGRMNLAMTTGSAVVATRFGDTLFTRRLALGGTVIASEPYDDDDDWNEVADHSVVTVTSQDVTGRPLQ